MKFRIYWEECHNPDNWVDEKLVEHYNSLKLSVEEYFGNEYCKKVTDSGIKNILESLPNKGYEIEDDGWIRVYCEDHFESDDIYSAKSYIADNYDIPDWIFTVYDDKKNRLFTEEDL